MQEVTVPFQIQCYYIWPTHHRSSWKARVRRAFGVCLRKKLWSLRYKLCKWCVTCTTCKQSSPQQLCLHQVIKAPQKQVAKCNHHTLFPAGKKEQPQRSENSLLHLNGTFERAVDDGWYTQPHQDKERAKMSSTNVICGTSKLTVGAQRLKEGINYCSNVFTAWRAGNHSSRQYGVVTKTS